MDNILATVLNTTFSLTQFKHKERVLKSYLEKTFFGGSPESANPSDLNWLKSLPASFYQNFNKDNIYELFTNLEQAVAKLPTLTMYLTFEPDDNTLTQIGTFVRKNFGQTLLLDIKLDPKLIAGTALVWRGILKDYSIKARIEVKKTEILTGFKKFLR